MCAKMNKLDSIRAGLSNYVTKTAKTNEPGIKVKHMKVWGFDEKDRRQPDLERRRVGAKMETSYNFSQSLFTATFVVLTKSSYGMGRHSFVPYAGTK